LLPTRRDLWLAYRQAVLLSLEKAVFCLAKEGQECLEPLAQLSSARGEKTVHSVCSDIHKELNGACGVSRWWAGSLLERLFYRKEDREQ